jgi:hypothetical protein
MPRARYRPLALTVLLAVTFFLTGNYAPSQSSASPGEDALTRHAREELASFTLWLRANNAKGYIGEVGWPEGPGTDSGRWNALAERWYQDADAADLWVTAWATGEWWGTSYPLAAYEDRAHKPGVDTPGSQAQVLERHGTKVGRLRGVNVAGAEFTAPNVNPTSTFSNANGGTHGRDYHYDGQATFDYLAARGARLIRIPFRWERIAPRLGRRLDQVEVGRLKAAVGLAHRAGLRVVLDMHNYGGYYLSEGRKGIRRGLGSRQIRLSAFADAWRRISIHFRRNPAVVGYGLMNEPVDLPKVGTTPPRVVWERASQAALTAIRANRDRKWVMVSSYPWGGVWAFGANHPNAWIRDPVDRVRYEAHQYFDHDNSGTYQRSYAEELAIAEARRD